MKLVDVNQSAGRMINLDANQKPVVLTLVEMSQEMPDRPLGSDESIVVYVCGTMGRLSKFDL